jgi:hypothetical protein
MRKLFRNGCYAAFLCAVLTLSTARDTSASQNPPADCSTANYSCFGKNLEFGGCTNYDCEQMGAWCILTLCNDHFPQHWECEPDAPSKPSSGVCKCQFPCVS